jgi:hypothetical protein
MVEDKDIIVNIGKKKAYAEIKMYPHEIISESVFRISIKVNQKILHANKTREVVLDFSCDVCAAKFSRSSRSIGSLCDAHQKEQARTKITEESIKKRTVGINKFYKSDDGKKFVEARGIARSEYLSTPEGMEQFLSTRPRGETAWNYNPEKEDQWRYAANVKAFTRMHFKKEVNNLENSQFRGKSGSENSYQLDHKISVNFGYENGIPAEVLGHICNLEFLRWEDNLAKSDNNSISLDTLLENIKDYNKQYSFLGEIFENLLNKEEYVKRKIPPKDKTKSIDRRRQASTGNRRYNDGKNDFTYTKIDSKILPFEKFLEQNRHFSAGSIFKAKKITGYKTITNDVINITMKSLEEAKEYVSKHTSFRIGQNKHCPFLNNTTH